MQRKKTGEKTKKKKNIDNYEIIPWMTSLFNPQISLMKKAETILKQRSMKVSQQVKTNNNNDEKIKTWTNKDSAC